MARGVDAASLPEGRLQPGPNAQDRQGCDVETHNQEALPATWTIRRRDLPDRPWQPPTFCLVSAAKT